MDKIGKKFPRVLNVLGFLGVVSGFIGMAFIFWILIKGTYSLFFIKNAVPVLSPVLPGVKIAGLPILSFWHWIIAILLIATIHEFSHGVYARKIGVKIKSSGFAFLGPLLAAFVEPDEKQLEKQKPYPQLQVLSAGPFSNILFAGLIGLIMLLVFNPVGSAIIEERGVVISAIDHNMPINNSLLKEGMSIDAINDYKIANREEFLKIMAKFKPGEKVFIKSGESFYEIELGKDSVNASKSKLGVFVSPASIGLKEEIKRKSFDFYPAYNWLYELMFWLFAISFGVGLFNLLPLGPVDGGRMFYVGVLAIVKNEKLAKRLYLLATWTCLILIFVNLMPFVIQFFEWVWGLIV